MNKVTKQLWKKSGIYCIVNIINQKRYIGSSKNLYNRIGAHRSYLRKGIHQNAKLQNAWNKYGEKNFQYFILEFCEEAKLLEREQFYINTIKPWYNIILEVQEVKISEESKKKMSKSRIKGFKEGTIKLYQEKEIHQYSLDGKYIQTFKSIKEAAETVGIARTSINRFLSGVYKKGGNFLWSLTKEDHLPPYVKESQKNYFTKPIEVMDINNNTITQYASLTEFSKYINKDFNSIRHAVIGGYPYLKRYTIKYILPCN